MTKREMLEAIARGEMTVELMEKAKEILAQDEATRAKHSEKQAEKAAEVYKPFLEVFVQALTEEPQTATDLLPKFEGMTTPSGKAPSVQFVSSLGTKAEKAHLCEKVEVKIKGKGTQKAYKIA